MTMQQTCVEGKIMDTFEKYYHEKVKVIEITTGEMWDGNRKKKEVPAQKWENEQVVEEMFYYNISGQ